jgi:hypothetical protein
VHTEVDLLAAGGDSPQLLERARRDDRLELGPRLLERVSLTDSR